MWSEEYSLTFLFLNLQCITLSELGVEATIVYARVDGAAGMSGCPAGVQFFQNRSHLVQEYASTVLEPKGIFLY